MQGNKEKHLQDMPPDGECMEEGGSDWLNRIMFNEHFADDLWHMGLHDDAF